MSENRDHDDAGSTPEPEQFPAAEGAESAAVPPLPADFAASLPAPPTPTAPPAISPHPFEQSAPAAHPNTYGSPNPYGPNNPYSQTPQPQSSGEPNPYSHPSGYLQQPNANGPGFGQPYGQTPYGQPQYGQPQAPYGSPIPQAQFTQNSHLQMPPGSVNYAEWAPPPTPGLIPLRPMSFGSLLGTPFKVLKRNPGVTYGSSLIVQFVMTVLSSLLVFGSLFYLTDRIARAAESEVESITVGSIAGFIVIGFLTLAFSLAGSALLQAIFVVEVARGTLGEKTTMGRVWKPAFKRIVPIMLWFLLAGFAIVIGLAIIAGIVLLGIAIGDAAIWLGIFVAVVLFLGLIVAIAWLSTKTTLVPSVIVLEQVGVFTAIKRSWSLTTNNFWRTLGAQVLLNMILSAASQVITTPLSLLGTLVMSLLTPTTGEPDPVAAIIYTGILMIVTLALGGLTALLQASLPPLIYIDLRMRKEGLDLELIRYVDAEGTSEALLLPDPYLPVSRQPAPSAA